jgi:hypothetical protein
MFKVDESCLDVKKFFIDPRLLERPDHLKSPQEIKLKQFDNYYSQYNQTMKNANASRSQMMNIKIRLMLIKISRIFRESANLHKQLINGILQNENFKPNVKLQELIQLNGKLCAKLAPIAGKLGQTITKKAVNSSSNDQANTTNSAELNNEVNAAEGLNNKVKNKSKTDKVKLNNEVKSKTDDKVKLNNKVKNTSKINEQTNKITQKLTFNTKFNSNYKQPIKINAQINSEIQNLNPATINTQSSKARSDQNSNLAKMKNQDQLVPP